MEHAAPGHLTVSGDVVGVAELDVLVGAGEVVGEGLGFVMMDDFAEMERARADIAGLIGRGDLILLETVVDGFEQLPTAINMLFDGSNVGKLVVKISD